MDKRLPRFTLCCALLVLFGCASAVGLASATTLDLPPSVPCITSTSGTITVPISINNFTPAGTGARGFSVTFKISSGLRFAPNIGGGISAGAYLTSTDPGAVVQTIINPPTFASQWGTAGTGTSQFANPRAICTDASGNVYVADYNNNRVQKFTSAGVFVTQWGSLGAGTGQFNLPFGIAADNAGNIFVSDRLNARIQKFSNTGTFLLQWGSAGAGDGQFTTPFMLATDASGNVYVSDNGNNRVQKFTGAGVYTTQWAVPLPTGIAIDAAGNVYVGQQNGNKVQKFTSTGTFLTQWGSTGAGNSQFSTPEGIAVDPAGDVYVNDWGNNRIEKFASDGTYLTQWGGPGTVAGQFDQPYGCATDLSGSVYIMDSNNNRVQKFTGPGSVTIDGVLTTATCATGLSGVVFNVVLGTTLTGGTSLENVQLIAAPASNPTATPSLRDCSNGPITLGAGVTNLNVQVAFPPPAISNLTAAPVKSGNSGAPAGVTGVLLTWTPGASTPVGATVDIWRAPFGIPAAGWTNTYPQYDYHTLFTASAPGTPTGSCPVTVAGWTKIATGLTTAANVQRTYTDRTGPRGFWYYVACLSDPCGNSPVSNMTVGTLNYFLGDVTDGVTPGTGDNKVTALDQSALGAAYGKPDGDPAYRPFLDFGPTIPNHSVDDHPHPDGFIGFEDLIIYSMNFNKGPSPQLAAVPAPADRNELTLEAPASVQAGQTFTVALHLKGAGDLQGLSTQLAWDASVVAPGFVSAGAMAEAQEGLVLSAGPGNVDAAVMGRDRAGFSGDGVLATVTFRAKVNGAPGIVVAGLDARDRSNQKLSLSGSVPASPLVTAFGPVSPNPFRSTATLAFSLAKAGRADLAIYSVDGRRVKTLASGARSAGQYRLTWDGTDQGGRAMQPGLFFARLITSDGEFTRTLVKVNGR